MSFGIKLGRGFSVVQLESLPIKEDEYIIVRPRDTKKSFIVYPGLLSRVERTFLQQVIDGNGSDTLLTILGKTSIQRFTEQHGAPPEKRKKGTKLPKTEKTVTTIKDANNLRWTESKYQKHLETVSPNFVNKEGILFWNDKQVIKEHEVNDKIKELYQTLPLEFMGRDSFYDYIKQHYVGISRRKVAEFLKTL